MLPLSTTMSVNCNMLLNDGDEASLDATSCSSSSTSSCSSDEDFSPRCSHESSKPCSAKNRAPALSVSFNDAGNVQVLLERIPEVFRNDVWFTADDYRLIKARDKSIVRVVRMKCFEESDDVTFRGLEHRMEKPCDRLTRIQSRLAVVELSQKQQQQQQQFQNDDDDDDENSILNDCPERHTLQEQIVQLYSVTSRSAARQAWIRGQQDAAAAAAHASVVNVIQDETVQEEIEVTQGQDGVTLQCCVIASPPSKSSSVTERRIDARRLRFRAATPPLSTSQDSSSNNTTTTTTATTKTIIDHDYNCHTNDMDHNSTDGSNLSPLSKMLRQTDPHPDDCHVFTDEEIVEGEEYPEEETVEFSFKLMEERKLNRKKKVLKSWRSQSMPPFL